MIKTNSILSENFLNAIKSAYTLNAELIDPLKIAVNNHVPVDPWHTLVTHTVSEIETQFWQRD